MHQRTRTRTSWIGGGGDRGAGRADRGRLFERAAARRADDGEDRCDRRPRPRTRTTGPTIVVAGHGEVAGTPDTMTMSIGVQTTNPTAQAALDQNNQRGQRAPGHAEGEGRRPEGHADERPVDLAELRQGLQHHRLPRVEHGDRHAARPRQGGRRDRRGRRPRSARTSRSTACRSRSTTRARCCATRREDAVKQAIAHARAARRRRRREARRRPQDRRHRHRRPAAASRTRGTSRPTAPRPTPIEAGSQQLSVDVAVTFARRTTSPTTPPRTLPPVTTRRHRRERAPRRSPARPRSSPAARRASAGRSRRSSIAHGRTGHGGRHRRRRGPRRVASRARAPGTIDACTLDTRDEAAFRERWSTTIVEPRGPHRLPVQQRRHLDRRADARADPCALGPHHRREHRRRRERRARRVPAR